MPTTGFFFACHAGHAAVKKDNNVTLQIETGGQSICRSFNILCITSSRCQLSWRGVYHGVFEQLVSIAASGVRAALADAATQSSYAHANECSC